MAVIDVNVALSNHTFNQDLDIHGLQYVAEHMLSADALPAITDKVQTATLIQYKASNLGGW